ncbi:M23 family metallopeptidase [Candidatus Uhrbacteria bacterium]|nr:M23 family metallopeptidase [Candidatus Uhrbacteria bacterium]
MRSTGFAFVYFILMVIAGSCVALATSCGTIEAQMDSSGVYGDVGGGGGQVVMHLPFSRELSTECVQGVNGAHSHRSRSTHFDLDLDTSNVADEPVFAPVSGIARVHTEDPSRNFGNHVNIDNGDGTYVVCAHLRIAVVKDDQEVAQGELIGYEGCTSNCTGDHVHIGLHRGDAGKMAQMGESIPSAFFVARASSPRGFAVIEGKDFMCGIRAMGDDRDGLFYSSALDTPLFHPNGSLVKLALDPRVYRIDNGLVRHIANEDVFRSYSYTFEDVALISDEEMTCYGEGSEISEHGMVNAVNGPDGALWLVVGMWDSPARYRIRIRQQGWEQVVRSWGLEYDGMDVPLFIDVTHGYWVHWNERPGYAKFRDGTLVKERRRSDIYVISDGVAVPIRDWETYLLLGFADRTFLTVGPGVVAQVMGSVGSCNGSSWCLDREAAFICAGGFDGEPPADNTKPGPSLDEGTAPQAHSPPDNSVPQNSNIPAQDDNRGGTQNDPSADPSESTPLAQSCEGRVGCLIDARGIGMAQTLALSDQLWLDPASTRWDAYLYGYGDCFDSYPDGHQVIHSIGGFYQIDFSSINRSCTMLMTLISSIGTDGLPPDEQMSNWNWWQSETLCRPGTPICNLMNNGTSWEAWLLSLAWDPQTGLTATGNALTSNAQL